LRRAFEILSCMKLCGLARRARPPPGPAYRAIRGRRRKRRPRPSLPSPAEISRAQADALEIEALAKRRPADAAQERGEARKRGGNDKVTKLPDGKFGPSGIGLNDKQLHEARTIRDAEARDPGVVRRTVDAAIAAGKEPTKARGRPRTR